MTVCLLGNYRPDYSRITVLRKGFLANGIKVVECQTRETGFRKYWELFLKHRELKNQYDYLVVCMGGHTLVWFARLLSKKKIIFDVFVSLYVTNVEDRKTCSNGSLMARYYAWLDKWSCILADKVLLDTNAQINFFVDQYGISRDKFIRLFVGSDNQLFYPQLNRIDKKNKFIIHWHGYIVPFYSLETVIDAAYLLKDEVDIHFNIITKFNNKYQKIKKRVDSYGLRNVDFISELNYIQLAEQINQSDVCLGIFGENKKAQLVIPNKIYEAIACGKPVITADHSVIGELFTDGKDIILCRPNSPEDLKEKILLLKNDKALRDEIATASAEIFNQKLSPHELIHGLIKNL